MSKTLKNNVTNNQAEGKENDNMNFDFQEDELIDIPTTCKAEGGKIITMEDISKMKFKDYRTEMVEGECTMKDIIFIHKEAGTKKDAVRVKRIQDIPDFLKDAIKVVDGKIQLECVEGTETAEFGAVIGYEVSEKTSSGYNCWVIGNAATNLVEKNGVFYKKATVMKAVLVDKEELPSFLFGAKTRKNADGSWTIKTSWGESTGFPGECYWVLYGKNEDGTPDANILTRTEKSFKDYLVCDENGEDLGWLSELDNIWRTGKAIYIHNPKGKRVYVTREGAKIDN